MTYGCDHPKVTMQGLRGMQERASDAETVQGRHELLPNLSTFTHAADYGSSTSQ